MDFHVMLCQSRRIHPIELGPVLMERYDRVAIKNGQEHYLTPSERGDRSIESGRCWFFKGITQKSLPNSYVKSVESYVKSMGLVRIFNISLKKKNSWTHHRFHQTKKLFNLKPLFSTKISGNIKITLVRCYYGRGQRGQLFISKKNRSSVDLFFKSFFETI